MNKCQGLLAHRSQSFWLLPDCMNKLALTGAINCIDYWSPTVNVKEGRGRHRGESTLCRCMYYTRWVLIECSRDNIWAQRELLFIWGYAPSWDASPAKVCLGFVRRSLVPCIKRRFKLPCPPAALPTQGGSRMHWSQAFWLTWIVKGKHITIQNRSGAEGFGSSSSHVMTVLHTIKL